jgi:hypothetical protein
MTSLAEHDAATLRQELREGLMEAVSFADFCRSIAGSDLEAEVHTLQAAAEALHSAAISRLPGQRDRNAPPRAYRDGAHDSV